MEERFLEIFRKARAIAKHYPSELKMIFNLQYNSLSIEPTAPEYKDYAMTVSLDDLEEGCKISEETMCSIEKIINEIWEDIKNVA